jgi:plasmid stabilization system protein ParE
VKLRLRPAALEDLAAAVAWYGEQTEVLADDFIVEFEACIERVGGGPDRYPVVMRCVRRALMRKFPYSVYFRVETDEIVVFAVYHQRRDPAVLGLRLRR